MENSRFGLSYRGNGYTIIYESTFLPVTDRKLTIALYSNARTHTQTHTDTPLVFNLYGTYQDKGCGHCLSLFARLDLHLGLSPQSFSFFKIFE